MDQETLEVLNNALTRIQHIQQSRTSNISRAFVSNLTENPDNTPTFSETPVHAQTIHPTNCSQTLDNETVLAHEPINTDPLSIANAPQNPIQNHSLPTTSTQFQMMNDSRISMQFQSRSQLLLLQIVLEQYVKESRLLITDDKDKGEQQRPLAKLTLIARKEHR